MLTVSATIRLSVETRHRRPLVHQNRRRTTTGKVRVEGNLPEAVVHLERDSENRADITLKATVRIRHVIHGILPMSILQTQLVKSL